MRLLVRGRMWRSPEGRDTPGCARTQQCPPPQDGTHGQVLRAGSGHLPG